MYQMRIMRMIYINDEYDKNSLSFDYENGNNPDYDDNEDEIPLDNI